MAAEVEADANETLGGHALIHVNDPTGSATVGGIIIPIDKIALLNPYFAMLGIVGIVLGVGLYLKRVRAQKGGFHRPRTAQLQEIQVRFNY